MSHARPVPIGMREHDHLVPPRQQALAQLVDVALHAARVGVEEVGDHEQAQLAVWAAAAVHDAPLQRPPRLQPHSLPVAVCDLGVVGLTPVSMTFVRQAESWFYARARKHRKRSGEKVLQVSAPIRIAKGDADDAKENTRWRFRKSECKGAASGAAAVHAEPASAQLGTSEGQIAMFWH